MSTTQILLQIFGLVAGWIIVHRQSSKRDIDKARREMIAKTADALSDDALAIFDAAKKYHLEERDLAAENSLKMLLQDLSIKTSLLGRVCPDETELNLCRRAILELKQAITAEHFEDEHAAALPLASLQIASMVECILKTKRALLELKLKQFPVA